MSQSDPIIAQESDQQINVEVCYALPDKQTLLSVRLKADATIEQIIETSGILEQYPSINLADSKVGVFSKLSKLGDTVHDGDRVEIYRPLLIEPKEVRKQRALKAKQDTGKTGKNKPEKNKTPINKKET